MIWLNISIPVIPACEQCKFHATFPSEERKKTNHFPLNPGCLMRIPIMVYYNPQTLNHQVFFALLHVPYRKSMVRRKKPVLSLHERMTCTSPDMDQGTNISHLGKRKIISKRPLKWDMLVPSRVIQPIGSIYTTCSPCPSGGFFLLPTTFSGNFETTIDIWRKSSHLVPGLVRQDHPHL